MLRHSLATYGRIEVLTSGAITPLVVFGDRPTVLPDLAVVRKLKRCRKAATVASEDVDLLNVERHRAHRP